MFPMMVGRTFLSFSVQWIVDRGHTNISTLADRVSEANKGDRDNQKLIEFFLKKTGFC